MEKDFIKNHETLSIYFLKLNQKKTFISFIAKPSIRLKNIYKIDANR